MRQTHGLDDGREGLETAPGRLGRLSGESLDDALRPQIGGVRAGRRAEEMLPPTFQPAVEGVPIREEVIAGQVARVCDSTGDAPRKFREIALRSQSDAAWGRPAVSSSGGSRLLYLIGQAREAIRPRQHLALRATRQA